MSKQTDTYMQRRREILEAAERCVLRDGLRKLRLRDLAKESGQSLGNFYNYFENKQALIEALVEKEVDWFIRSATIPSEPLPPGATYRERLRRRLETFVSAYLSLDGVKTMMSIASEALVDPKVRAILTAANKRVCERVIANISDEDRELIERLPPGAHAADALDARISTRSARLRRRPGSGADTQHARRSVDGHVHRRNRPRLRRPARGNRPTGLRRPARHGALLEGRVLETLPSCEGKSRKG